MTIEKEKNPTQNSGVSAFKQNRLVQLNSSSAVWAEHCAHALGTTPEIVVNTILILMQTEIGITNENIKEWIKRPKKIEEELKEALKETISTRVAVEETARSVQLYLNQIHKEKFPAIVHQHTSTANSSPYLSQPTQSPVEESQQT